MKPRSVTCVPEVVLLVDIVEDAVVPSANEMNWSVEPFITGIRGDVNARKARPCGNAARGHIRGDQA